MQEDITEELNQLERRRGDLSDILIALKNIESTLQVAFPDGPEKHGEYHQDLINAAKAQKKFWDDLYSDLKQKGIRSIILVLVGIVVVKFFGNDAFKLLITALH